MVEAQAARLFLLSGKEEFLKEEFIQDLRQKLGLNDTSADSCFKIFQPKKDEFADFCGFIQTAPFLSSSRLAVIKDIDELDDEFEEKLFSVVKSLPSYSYLVMTTTQSTSRPSAFLAVLMKYCQTTPYYTPFDRDFPGYLQTRARRMNVELKLDAALFLIENIGKNLMPLEQCLKQASIYVHPKKVIEAQDVRALFAPAFEADTFALLDFIIEKNTKAAIDTLLKLQTQGVKSFEMLSAIIGGLDRLSKAVSLMKKGLSVQMAADEMKINSFFQTKFKRQLSMLSTERMDLMFAKLLRCDESIKTGKAKEKEVFEKLVLELCLG